MAMKDWNGDGKIDGMDHYIEEEIFKDSTKEGGSSYKRGGGKKLGYPWNALGIVGGLILEALFFIMLGVDSDELPLIVLLIGWIFFSSLLFVLMEKMDI